MSKKWYVTTPIYYVTAKPHLGSLYSTLLADVIARWKKLQGREVFLTGTDEHGQKVAQAAEQAGKEPKEFIDGFIGAYKDAWHKYGIEYSYFIRTTDDYHVKAVQQWLKYLQEKGSIYKGEYTGWYCTPCETFITSQEDSPLCSSCGRPTEYVTEETYFFKLSVYQDKLLKFYKDNPNFIVPKARANEVINFVKEGLKDLSISRTTVTWGIPFPDDEKHVSYVWADALNNYITAVGYGNKYRQSDFQKWWPADTHVMGKDIVRFHAVYWPAFLLASGLPLPKQLLVHGWIKTNNKKMSKSLGNVVDPMELYTTYGPDQVRYYLLRHMAITQDGDFTIKHLEEVITTDLANNLGNLLNRTIALAEKNQVFDIKAPEVWHKGAIDLRDECLNMLEDVHEYMDEYLFHMALARAAKYISSVNAYFHLQEPWKLAKIDKDLFNEALSAVCHSLYVVAIILWPTMPHKMPELLKALGSAFDLRNNTIEKLELGMWNKEFMLHKTEEPLFIKPYSTEATKDRPNYEGKTEEKKSFGLSNENVIDIKDFAKVHLVVGTIMKCEIVEKSEKLLKLTVNCGQYGVRQILSGVRKYFMPEDMINKQGVFVVNLKPRKMMDMISEGMMLLADDGRGNLQMMMPGNPVPNGTQLK